MLHSEFVDWQAYYRLEPFGEWRADVRSGIVASTMANIWRGKNGRRMSAKDFMPEFGQHATNPEKQTEFLVKKLMGLFGRGKKED